MDSIEIMFKEYDSIRQEILYSISNRPQILSYGLAGIGAVIAASITVFYNFRILSVAALSLIVPSISILTVIMFLGEYQRSQRDGCYLAGLEKKINQQYNNEKHNKQHKDTTRNEQEISNNLCLLHWECYLREHYSIHIEYPYKAIIMTFSLISFISVVVGLIALRLDLPSKDFDPTYKILTEIGEVFSRPIIWHIVVGTMLIHILIYWSLYKYTMKKIKYFSKSIGKI